MSSASRALGAASARQRAAGRRLIAAALLGGRLVLWVLAGLAIGIALALVAPLAFHGRPLTVLSGSMEPTLHVGDMVVANRIKPLDARPGDIVSFRDPARGEALVTHRVRSLRAEGDRVVFVTRGDANNSSERWRIRRDGEISRALYTVPKLGHVVGFARTKSGVFIGMLLPLLLLGIWEIAAIWSREGPDA
jgi:signal peptidase